MDLVKVLAVASLVVNLAAILVAVMIITITINIIITIITNTINAKNIVAHVIQYNKLVAVLKIIVLSLIGSAVNSTSYPVGYRISTVKIEPEN